jgi:hypothetical protein
MQQQMTLLDMDEAIQKEEGWFQHALGFFNLSESPGWPDHFGTAFHNWYLSQKITNIKTLTGC